jgi:DNA-binding beta-propeller fold protein YncE
MPSAKPAHRRFRLVVVAVSVVVAVVGSVLLAMRASSARTTTQGVTATLRVAGHPQALVAGPDALWVALTRDSDKPAGAPRLQRLDLATNAPAQPVYLNGEVFQLARAGERLVASIRHPSGLGELAVLDWSSGLELAHHWFDAPIDQTVVRRGALWALEEHPARLLRLDSRTLEPTAAPLRLARGQTPALTTGDGYLWVTAADSGEVLRIDPATRQIERVRVGGSPAGTAVVGGSIWFSDHARGVVRRLDPRSLRLLGDPIRVGKKPKGLAATAGSLFVTGEDGTIVRIDVTSASKLGAPIRIAAKTADGTAPSVSPSGQSVWVSSVASNTLSRIDPASGSGSGGGAVTVRITGTNKSSQHADHVTDGGLAGTGRFVASGAISERGKVVLYRTMKPPLITLRFVASDSKGTVTYLVKIDMNFGPEHLHPWTITSATRAYEGLHGEGIETENADFTVSTLTGTVSR